MDSFAPVLALRLADYNLSDKADGLVFALQPATYVLSTFLLPWLIPDWVPHRVTLFTALLVISFCTLLVGPFFAPKNLASMLVGLGVGGFPQSMMVIPNMAEMMQACKVAFPEV